MLKLNTIFGQLRRKIAIIMLAGLVWLISLPVNSVQAAGNSTGDYATKEKIEQKMGRNDNVTPDISTPDIGGEDYVDSGRRAAEVIPKNLGTGSRQKNPIEMLKRAGEELGKDQIQRAFGAEDYNRSPIEQELARNKAQRGDY